MVPIQVVLIAGVITLGVWGGEKAVQGVKHVSHAISAKLHHHKITPETK
jgi:hypothetical protein